MELAAQRRQVLSNLTYKLYIDIPENPKIPILGRGEIDFELNESINLPIDFRASDSSIMNITVNYRQIRSKLKNGHIIIPKIFLKKGQNKVSIDFILGKTSLNRKGDYLFSLLVPDRASTVFPCFDQPDLKAIYTLTLQTPKSWVAVSNAPVINKMSTDTSTLWLFGKTEPISTYLFAFATGRFDTLSANLGRFRMTIYHRETDKEKLNRSIKEVVALHKNSVEWLQNYTTIPYPFSKLDIVLIPDFPYSGMEHPGAIFYRDNRILLDENPSVTQMLSRANLIAHEVSHQWFGNLVTMTWFNDVWLKEVFANLMADKIVNPQYPKINHDLSFLLSHYPKAYTVDRTNAANPIRQNLDNLLLAGTLYGDIIYHKAPIALRQLELMMGESDFQKGLQIYLKRFAYSNADWNQLIGILDSISTEDIRNWNKRWIESPSMPTFSYQVKNGTLLLTQDEHWLPMQLNVSIPNENGYTEQVVKLRDRKYEVTLPNNFNPNKQIIVNSNGLGYGLFISDDSIAPSLSPALYSNNIARAATLINLHEQFLNHQFNIDTYFALLTEMLERETNSQIREYLLTNLQTVWWQFMGHTKRIIFSQKLENTLETIFKNTKLTADERKPAFITYCKTVVSPKAVAFVKSIWASKTKIKGITLSENDFISLAYELALRNVPDADSILSVQEQRIQNADRLAKYRFVKRAASPDDAIRDDFFHSLLLAQNRRPEPWVAEGLQYFFHPLRTEHSIHYLNAALNLLPEIQQTNDIFFPKIWLDAVLYGHNSKEAIQIVTKWLNDHPTLSPNLKAKLLQSANPLFRAAGKN